MESGPFRPAMLSLLFPRPGLAVGLSQSVSQGQGFILGVHPAQARVQLYSWLGKILLFRGFVFMMADRCCMLSSLVSRNCRKRGPLSKKLRKKGSRYQETE